MCLLCSLITIFMLQKLWTTSYASLYFLLSWVHPYVHIQVGINSVCKYLKWSQKSKMWSVTVPGPCYIVKSWAVWCRHASLSMLVEKKWEAAFQTLEELSESLELLETLQGRLATTQAQIPLIHEQIAILGKCESPVEQAVSCSLINKNIHTCLWGPKHRLQFVK